MMRSSGAERRRLLAVDERHEQPVEVAELVVDDGARHARLARHRLDVDGVEAVRGQQLERGVEQLPPPLLGGQPRRAGSGLGRHSLT